MFFIPERKPEEGLENGQPSERFKVMVLTPWYDFAEERSKPNNPSNGLR